MSTVSGSGAPTCTCRRRLARSGRLLAAAPERISRRVFNAGHSDENFRKLDLVKMITEHLGRGDVVYVHRDEDPRDYKVSFQRIRTELGFTPETTVADGIAEIAKDLDGGTFGDPFNPRYSNVAT
jgi:nucleoside-diphosphate-sugar epimerase